MKPGTENETEGKIREVKVKEKAGHLTNNRDLEEARVSRPRRIGFRRFVWVWPVTAVAGVFAAVLAASPQAPAPGPAGRDLAANCYQCHGTLGRPVGGMPSIAGKDASSLYRTMLEYKATPEADRNDDIMVPIARAYSDQQLWEMALYIAGLPGQGGTPTAKPLKPVATHSREDDKEDQR
jgi:cytochrome c553